MRILQITDTHLFGDHRGRLLGVNTQHSFKAVLQQSSAENIKPDIVLLTGDLAQDFSVSAYKRLSKEVLDTFNNCPIYWIPGNHDDPERMESVLTKTDFNNGKLIRKDNWQIILLNSHSAGHVSGHIVKKELNWLEQCLQEQPELFTLICLHHQPIPINSKWLDTLGLKNANDFLKIIDHHPQVRCVLWGHIHQEFSAMRKGIPYLATPSTCFQFLPKQDNFALDPVAQPGYRWLELLANGEIKSCVKRLVNFKLTVDLNAWGY